MQACFAGIGERGFMIPETMDHLASIPGLHVCAERQRVLRTRLVGKSLHPRFAGIRELRVVVFESLDHPAPVVRPEVFAEPLDVRGTWSVLRHSRPRQDQDAQSHG